MIMIIDIITIPILLCLIIIIISNNSRRWLCKFRFGGWTQGGQFQIKAGTEPDCLDFLTLARTVLLLFRILDFWTFWRPALLFQRTRSYFASEHQCIINRSHNTKPHTHHRILPQTVIPGFILYMSSLQHLTSLRCNVKSHHNVIAKYSRTRRPIYISKQTISYEYENSSFHPGNYIDNRPTYIKKTYDAFALENFD